MKRNDLSEKLPAPRPVFDIVANIDGGARGNPGPAAYGVIIRNGKGEVLAEFGKYLGIRTNNVAEYSALLAALEWAIQEGVPALRVLSDSELMVRQMLGQYRVKHPDLKNLYDRARDLKGKLKHFAIEHVRRESNRDADRLVNQVLDSHFEG